MILTLLGEPRSTGSIYKMVCRGKFGNVYMSKDGKELKESYQWQAKSQWKNKSLIKEDLEISIWIYFGTKRKADWDNFHKLSMDALTGIVWVDDSQIQSARVFKLYDPLSPRIEIEINEMDK